MADTYRKESRKDWSHAGETVYVDDLKIGCLQRIADATELMAKRHSDLIAEAERHKSSRDYWEREYDQMARRLIAARGQITKLKKKLESASVAAGEK